MESINSRIRDLRRNFLHINQRQFAADLGMAQTGISSMEQDGATITDRVIKSICLTYNVNEEWLRTGTGEMYVRHDTFSLQDFAAEHGITELETQIIKTYLELPRDIRQAVVEHFRQRFGK